MSILKRIARNTVFNFISENITKILTLLITIFIARHLGDDSFGIYSLAISFTGLFAILVSFGTNSLLVREIVRDKKKAQFFLGNILSLKLFFSAITFILIFISVNLLSYPQKTLTAVYLFALIVIVDSYSDTFYYLFQGYENMEYQAVIKVIRVLMRVALTAFLLIKGFGLISIILVYLFVSIINLIGVMILCSKKYFKIRLCYDYKMIKYIFVKGLPFAVTSVFFVIYFRIDVTMLSKMTNDAVVGWYSAAYNLFDAMTFIPIVFSSAIFPVAIGFYKISKQKLQELFELSEKIITFIAFPIAFGGSILAREIILFIYSSKYENSIPALQWLVWTTIPMFMIYIMSVVFLSIDKEKIGMWILGICSVVNIVLNFLLIPRYSYVGSSIATLLSEIVYFLLFIMYLHRYGFKFSLIQVTWRPLLASIIMGFTINYLKNYLNVIIVIAIGALIYSIVVLLTKGLGEKEIVIIRKLMSR